MQTTLLETRLRPPMLPSRAIARPHLTRILQAGFDSGGSLALISAPAGFGKTICALEWLQAQRASHAWLSMDSADDDPGRFFLYLIAALQKIDDGIGRDLFGVLRSGQVPPGEILCASLINDLFDLEARFILVLDDFQTVQDPAILRFFETLSANPPPAMYFVLITREDPALPLARIRAAGRLTEIRAAALRFTGGEPGRFLAETLGLDLSLEDVSALEERTEGWAAGLHLAGLSLRGREDASEFIARLSGSHLHILSYLTEEVIHRQPEETQRFLRQTSVLERLNGELCDAVTGHAGGGEMLRRLCQANLFLDPLDEDQRWYRYHPLFADLLRERLAASGEDVPELRRRAARWLAQAGMAREAVDQALAAADYAFAVDLIERHAMDMLMQWHLKTVDGWMQRVPESWLTASPKANLAFAWVKLMRGAHAEAMPYLQRLPAMIAEIKKGALEPALEAKWLALQAMTANAQGRAEESAADCRRALEIAPADRTVRCMILMALADAYQIMERSDLAMQSFQQIIQLGREEGNSLYELLGVSGLALLAYKHGRLRYAFSLAAAAIERMEASGALPPVSMAVYGELAVICYQWFQLDRAHAYFQRAVQVSRLSGFSDAKLFYGVIQSRLHQMEGDLESASREIGAAEALMRLQAAVVVREEVVAQYVRVLLAQDRPAEAETVLEEAGFPYRTLSALPKAAEGRNNLRATGALHASALRILLYRVRTRGDEPGLEAGLRLADEMVAEGNRRDMVFYVLETLLLRAQLLMAAGRIAESRADLQRAVKMGEPEGVIGFFAEEGVPIAGAITDARRSGALEGISPAFLDALQKACSGPERPATEEDSLPEGLSEREGEVLRLVAEGLQYGEIAERLFISLNTVRSHIKSIYGKFGVNNRTRAIEIAHRLRFL